MTEKEINQMTSDLTRHFANKILKIVLDHMDTCSYTEISEEHINKSTILILMKIACEVAIASGISEKETMNLIRILYTEKTKELKNAR